MEILEILLAYSSAIIFMLAIDLIWIKKIAYKLYTKNLAHLINIDTSGKMKAKVLPGLLFYLIYIAAILFFAVNPSISEKLPILKSFFRGIFLGLTSYSTYDLTNYSTLKNFPFKVALIDIVWGSLLTGIISGVATLLVIIV